METLPLISVTVPRSEMCLISESITAFRSTSSTTGRLLLHVQPSQGRWCPFGRKSESNWGGHQQAPQHCELCWSLPKAQGARAAAARRGEEAAERGGRLACSLRAPVCARRWRFQTGSSTRYLVLAEAATSCPAHGAHLARPRAMRSSPAPWARCRSTPPARLGFSPAVHFNTLRHSP